MTGPRSVSHRSRPSVHSQPGHALAASRSAKRPTNRSRDGLETARAPKLEMGEPERVRDLGRLARRIERLLGERSQERRGDCVLDVFASCQSSEIEPLLAAVKQRGCFERLFERLEGRNYQNLITMLAQQVRDPALVMACLDQLKQGGQTRGERDAALEFFACAEARGELPRLHASIVAAGRQRDYLGGIGSLEALRRRLPARAEAFPFAAGRDGGLSTASDFSRFLAMPDPTEAEIGAATRTTLLDYFRTAQFGEFVGTEGVPIRYAMFTPPPGVPVKGVVNVAAGMLETMVKYSELYFNLRNLRAQGYVIATMDHRGQGFSGREVQGPMYVQDFGHYVRDEQEFTSLLQKRYGREVPYTLIGHSMGGAICARYAQEHPRDYDAIVLLSPMMNIASGFPDWLEAPLAAAGAAVAPERLAIGQKPYGVEPFEDNKLTRSRERFLANQWLYERFETIRVGGPTWNWSNESIGAGREILRPENLERLHKKDVHLLRAQDDRLVEIRGQDEFCSALGIAPHSWPGEHELLSAPDAVRREVIGYLERVITAR